MKLKLWMLRYDFKLWLGKIFIKFIWSIPPKIALWCFIRVVTYSEDGGFQDWYKDVHDSFLLGHKIKKM